MALPFYTIPCLSRGLKHWIPTVQISCSRQLSRTSSIISSDQLFYYAVDYNPAAFNVYSS